MAHFSGESLVGIAEFLRAGRIDEWNSAGRSLVGELPDRSSLHGWRRRERQSRSSNLGSTAQRQTICMKRHRFRVARSTACVCGVLRVDLTSRIPQALASAEGQQSMPGLRRARVHSFCNTDCQLKVKESTNEWGSCRIGHRCTAGGGGSGSHAHRTWGRRRNARRYA